jgi:hypothetical protein
MHAATSSLQVLSICGPCMARNKSELTIEIERKRQTCVSEFQKGRDAACHTHNYRLAAASKDIISVIIQKSLVFSAVIMKFIFQNIRTTCPLIIYRRLEVTRGNNFLGL